jgi:hypothetical protein
MAMAEQHLFDTELAGLARRGYQGGMPLELLSDAFVYEDAGRYFHTIDGRFAKIWKISGHDHSLLNNDSLYHISDCFGDVLNKYPEDSCGQFIRHTHRDIRPILKEYLENIDKDAGEFAIAIANSIVERQTDASMAKNGFFSKLSTEQLQVLQADVREGLDKEGVDVDVRENISAAIEREIREGRFPFVTDFYLVFLWSPTYIFGKFIDKAFKGVLASVGLADADKLAHEAYTKQSVQFGRIAHNIGQSLATYNFYPEELTGQGFINFQYQLLNPVRSYNVEPPEYFNDIPVYECLREEVEVPLRNTLTGATSYSWVETEQNGWTIHDSGFDYYVRPVSILGKPGKSFPGMLQKAMAGIEAESLITINWKVPSKLVAYARLMARGRLLAAKNSMHLGDADTRAQQSQDMEYVKGRISSENVSTKSQFFDTAVHINLMGFDKTILEEQGLQLQDLLWRLGHREELRGDAVVRNSMPLNFRASSMSLLRRDTPYLTENLAHLCPLFLEYQGVYDSAIMMNNRSGRPIFIDLWGSNVVTAHSLICGTTGSGKSFAFNNLLMGLRVKYRPKVWIIDKGDSYRSLCSVLDGNYIPLALEPFQDKATGRTVNPICLNPFHMKKNDDGERELPTKPERELLVDMLTMMMEVSGAKGQKIPLQNLTVPLLHESLSSFYSFWLEKHSGEEPTFSKFIPHLRATTLNGLNGDEIAAALSMFYGNGLYSAVFDGFLQVDWDNDFTVLETQRMADSPALGVVTLGLFRQIDAYAKYKLDKKRKKLIAVDEAWATLSNAAAASALAGFYREMRKYNAGCFLISQTVKDFVNLIKYDASGGGGSGGGQDGILENTSHYFFLACSPSDYKLAAEELSFSPEEIDLWKSLASLPPMYSEIFYRMRTGSALYYSGVFRLFASAVSMWVSSSHPDDDYMRERKTQQLFAEGGISEALARQRAIVALSKSHPYGARFHVEDAA